MTRLHLRDRWRRNPMWGDAVLMLLLSPWTILATASITRHTTTVSSVALVVVGIASTLPLAWRRSHPERMALVVVAAHVVQLLFVPDLLPSNVVVPVVLYAVVAHGNPRWTRHWLALGLAASLAAGLRWGFAELGYPPGNALHMQLTRAAAFTISCALTVVASWALGMWARQRRVTLETLRERAEALEREHSKGIALVAEEERNRLAREMHDIVAHSLSVIVVQADGAGYLAAHPELDDAEARLAQVTRAIETIGQTARTALGETRRLVGVLRNEDDAVQLAPAATLDQIGELVEQLAASGIPASHEVQGDPAAHGPLGSGAEMAAYRVVQESLTNVLKHAGPGATVHVTLTHDADGIRLRVADTGRGGSGGGATAGDGLGHGVVGLRERVAAWGGSLVARPRISGGFEVLAQLPAADPHATTPATTGARR